MSVRLLPGWFGSPEAYAANGFETMEPEEGSFFISSIYGDTKNGNVHFDEGFFGPQSPP